MEHLDELLDEEFSTFPLSFAQQRLWFMEQWEAGNPIYLISTATHLTGQLNVQALEQSLWALIQRHESLRTAIVTIDGQAVQCITPPHRGKWQLAIVDLAALPEGKREIKAQQLVEEEARKPFDLSHGPLLRAALLRLSQNEHILFLTLHHIIGDGWSMGIIFRELAVCYNAYVQHTAVPLPELPIQYADFTVWQQQWLEGQQLEQLNSYWRQRLAHMPEALLIPTDYPRVAIATSQGAIHHFMLPQPLALSLQRLSRETGTTLFMTLVAAFNVLLYHYTAQEDLVVGTTNANRNHSEIENLVGFFVNTIILRNDLSGNPTFREIQKRVRTTCLEAYAHQDLPFEKLVEDLFPGRDTIHNPPLQVLLTMQNALKPLELDGLQPGRTEVLTEIGSTNFDIALDFKETPDGIAIAFEYNCDLFDTTTIRRMANHYSTVLEHVAANPDLKLRDIPLLSAEELNQLLVGWNTQPTQPCQRECIHHLFERLVDRTPDAIAITYDQEHITYQALNERANQLAHYLRACSVSPDDLVGLCLERSLEVIVCLLGVLKAGGAFIYLDINYPQKHLSFLLDDAKLTVLLTQEHLEHLFSQHQVQLVVVEREKQMLAQQSKENLSGGSVADNLAYAIYTSGSTGQPKGVLIQHASLANYCGAFVEHYSLQPGDRVLQFASFSFDVALEEIFPTLISGATLVMWPDRVSPSLTDFQKFVERERLSIIDIPVIYWREWISELSSTRLTVPSTLRLVVVGGERAAPEWLVSWESVAAEEIAWSNAYGPTETTITALTYEAQRPDMNPWILPIGRPIAHTQAYLLDDQMKPVPIGVVGDLYIGGMSLARGYLRCPELTAERFVPHPFSTLPGERLYKTGDRARYLADGNVDFVGRIDRQVKIRGFRIEIEEIASKLRQHPAVEDALILVREDTPGDKKLIAYMTLISGRTTSVHHLRMFAKEQLPEYMLPSAFVLLEAFPLTPHNKIDYQALLTSTQDSNDEDETFVAPQSATEQALAAIWAETLEQQRIGLHDNFFAIGGHSLKAIRVVAQVRSTFQIELSLRTLFEKPTIASLAAYIDTHRSSTIETGQPLVPIVREQALPLSFAQQWLWLANQWTEQRAVYNIPTRMLLTGRLDVAALEQSIHEIICRHEILRTVFIAKEGQPLQHIIPCSEISFDLPIIDVSALPVAQREEEIRKFAAEEARHPFNLQQGPLMQMKLLRLSASESLLLLTQHHIISDDWSLRIFFHELEICYQAFSSGERPDLPALSVHYADFAFWQRQRLQGTLLATQLAYWKQQLMNAPSLLAFPTDKPRPPVQTFDGATKTITLSPKLSDELQAISHKEHTTLFMTLLAAFYVLLYRYSGQSDIVVGSPIANRTQAETERIIGFFLNTLVLRTHLAGHMTFHDILQQVRTVTLDAYAHQDIPFEMLVEELHLERDLSWNPLFQVLFMLQDALPPLLELPDLTLQFVDSEAPIAQLDLVLCVIEEPSGLDITLAYNVNLFYEDTIARMLGHFQALLETLVSQPELPLSMVPLLTVEEQQQILYQWNMTQTDYPIDTCFPQLFEAQVARTPDAIAVVYENAWLTYDELNLRANRLAHHLKKQGVDIDVLVALLIERSTHFLIAILAIFKAGGAFLPLDPQHPTQRQIQVLRQSHCSLLLTVEQYSQPFTEALDTLEPDPQQPLCILQIEPLLQQGEAAEHVSACSVPGALAYTIYTSGSTGKPKGAMIEQIGMVNHLLSKIADLHLDQKDVAAQTAPPCFDISIWQFLAVLLVGGRVHIFKDEVAQDPVRLLEHSEQESITILQPVPSLLRAMVQRARVLDAERPRLAALRWLVPTGEALPPELCRHWLELYPAIPLLNAYGSTECSDDQCSYPIHQPPAIDYPLPTVPIGHALQNTETYVLDQWLNPVPIGVAGDLYIGGIGVGRGYRNAPALTAEAFLPHPFTQIAGSRLYKTRDKARYLTDGMLEFLGRSDQLVKINGVRIEPGEIEVVLEQLLPIREAVVLAKEAPNKNKYLVAYIVPDQEHMPNIEAMRTLLGDQLPEYMIPRSFMILEAMPLNTNGKVDRKALLELEPFVDEQETQYVAPGNQTERAVAAIWQRVLCIEQIGIHDNFFDLGGHSFQMAQVYNLLREELQHECSMIDLFKYPTIATLSKYLDQGQREQTSLHKINERVRKQKEAQRRHKR